MIHFNKVTKSFTLKTDLTFQNIFISPSRILSLTRKKKLTTPLKNVSFKIHKGECIGFSGHNGCGKSTLLKLIAGILKPTQGTLAVNGKVAPLLELGAGFHPELSGHDNIFLYGSLLGMNKKQILERLNEIKTFADIGDFIDTKTKYLSSGMRMRLGLSIAIHSDFDILLVDELLSIGDEAFKQKFIQKLLDFKKQNKTILMVSHDLKFLLEHTNKIFLFRDQTVREFTPSNIQNPEYPPKICPSVI